MELSYGGSPQFSFAGAWDAIAGNPLDSATALALMVLTLLLLWGIKTALLGPSFQFRRMTLPSLFLKAYLIIMLVPSIFWFVSSADPIRYTTLIAIDAAPILFLLGAWLANIQFKIKPNTVLAFLNAELAQRPQDKLLGKAATWMLAASIAIAALYAMTAQYIPLLASLKPDGGSSSESFRLSIYTLPDALIFAYAVATRLFLPFCVLYTYFMARVHGKAWWPRFVGALLLALVIASFSLERSPSLGLFLLLLVAYPLTAKKSHLDQTVKKSHLLRYMGILFAAMLLGGLIHQAQYQLDVERSSLFDYMSGFLLNRVWMDPSFMTMTAFQKFNYSTTFLDGSSIRILSLVGISYESYSSIGFVGDLWVNFGWTGVIVGCTLLGFILQWIQARAFKVKTAPVLMIYILFLINLLWLLYGSILSIMVITVILSGLLILRILAWMEAGMSPLAVRRGGPRRNLERLPQQTT